MKQATLLAVLVMCANLGQAQDAKTDKDKLQGTWLVTAAERDGQPYDRIKDDKLTIVKDRVTVKKINGTSEELTFTLDPTNKPKTIDFRTVKGEDRMIRGIYVWEGGALKICLGRPDADRPTEFSSKGDVILVTLKKEEPKGESK